jgi:imidazolonepropionase-like amidohydrolase
MKCEGQHDSTPNIVRHSRSIIGFVSVLFVEKRSKQTLRLGLFTTLTWLSLVLAVAIPSLSNAQNDDADAWVVVHAGTLLSVPGKKPEKEKTIVIKNGVIASVLDGYIAVENTAAVDAEIVSLKNSFVLPGLMDMHVHLRNGVPALLMDDARRVFGSKVNNDADSAIIATSNAQSALMTGYTTVRDAGSDGPSVFSVRDGIERGLIYGPRIFLAGEQVHVTDGNSWFPSLPHPLCDGSDACRWKVREQIRRGADFIKIAVSGSGSEDNGGPDDPPEMFDDEIKAVVDTAHSMLRPVSAHAHGTASINAALRNGVDSIEHGSFPDRESIRLYKQNGAIFVPTLAYITRWNEEYLAALVPYQKIRKSQFRELQPKGVAMAYKAGVVIAAGSDVGSGLMTHGLSPLEPIAYVELAGLSEMDAIVTATINGAKLLRKEDVLGTLEPGKYADLIATNTSPLEDIRVLLQVTFVMKGGVVYKNEQ